MNCKSSCCIKLSIDNDALNKIIIIKIKNQIEKLKEEIKKLENRLFLLENNC